MLLISRWTKVFWVYRTYRKFSKYLDTQKLCCNHSKIWTIWLYHRVVSPNNADGMANSVDPDQTVWSGSALFAQAYLSENLGSLQYVIYQKSSNWLCWVFHKSLIIQDSFTKFTVLTLHHSFLYPTTQKVAGYYVIPSENFECLSIHPSVSTSFTDSNLSSFWPIFFQTLHGHWYQEGVVWDCKWAKFIYKQ